MVIVDGDYHSGRQVRVIRSTNFNVMRHRKEITVAISDTIGNTSFRNNTNAHESIISYTKDSDLYFPCGMSIIHEFYVKSNKFFKTI